MSLIVSFPLFFVHPFTGLHRSVCLVQSLQQLLQESFQWHQFESGSWRWPARATHWPLSNALPVTQSKSRQTQARQYSSWGHFWRPRVIECWDEKCRVKRVEWHFHQLQHAPFQLTRRPHTVHFHQRLWGRQSSRRQSACASSSQSTWPSYERSTCQQV